MMINEPKRCSYPEPVKTYVSLIEFVGGLLGYSRDGGIYVTASSGEKRLMGAAMTEADVAALRSGVNG